MISANESNDTIIIGAGLAGLSAAYHLRSNYKIIEANKEAGGLCRSKFIDGFLFDYTGHLLHIKSEYVEHLVKQLLDDNLKKIERKSWIYSLNTLTPYPFQSNLYGLPPDVVKECLIEFIKSKYELREMEVKNFEDWVIKHLGRGIANRFMIPYNKKLWTVNPRDLTTEWMGNYVPNPTIDEIVDGALRVPEKKWGYNSCFYYPKHGGIQSLINAFLKHIDINCVYYNKKVAKINMHEKIITYSDGTKDTYKNIISTIPLINLVSIIEHLPNEIQISAKKLKYNSVLNINVGLNGEYFLDKHWVYFPEDQYIFYRIGFPTSFSKSMAPNGCSSIYTEISYSDAVPLRHKSLEEIQKRVYADLIKAKFLNKSDDVIFSFAIDIKPAYVIYDNNWSYVKNNILDYIRKRNILSIGRYGSWEYSAMEDAILQGKDAAEFINSGVSYGNTSRISANIK